MPMVSKDVNAPQQLMQPQRKCARTLQEPEAPDMEEAFHQIMMAPQKEGDVSVLKDANVEDIDDAMLKDYVRNSRICQEYSRNFKNIEELSMIIDKGLALGDKHLSSIVIICQKTTFLGIDLQNISKLIRYF